MQPFLVHAGRERSERFRARGRLLFSSELSGGSGLGGKSRCPAPREGEIWAMSGDFAGDSAEEDLRAAPRCEVLFPDRCVDFCTTNSGVISTFGARKKFGDG
jgi:hypothetical protein